MLTDAGKVHTHSLLKPERAKKEGKRNRGAEEDRGRRDKREGALAKQSNLKRKTRATPWKEPTNHSQAHEKSCADSQQTLNVS